MFREEECALGMEQRAITNCAGVVDVQIMSCREECALGMEQRSSDAAAKDAQI